MLGVFLDTDTVTPHGIDLTALTHTLPEWRVYGSTRRQQIAERIAPAEVVISNKVLLDAPALAKAPKLKLICIAATGTNNVDLAAANARGIVVCNVKAYATPSVVQHVFALMLALKTRFAEYQQAIRAGAWQRSPHFSLLDFPIDEIHGATLGIVGYGELGRAVAAVAQAFGMNVLVANRPGQPLAPDRLPLDDLLARVDVISLHCPLTPETRNLLSRDRLARLRPHAILINTARGGLVDEQALADQLNTGRLAGAAIDVLEQEPPPASNPLLAAPVKNLIVTPHIAWASRQSRQRLVDAMTENIRAFLRGEPRNVV